ncbi:cytidylyltransferase domain-containing protein [Tepidibacillus sp. HK-1]|uniref:acylneuraminate cytidylyltransferase family protein n=1 Tax=Tepidibacillus sp. HK-1 TaxID=1883407 RepID=UPI0008535B61|nr:acylneuraminate cytidylyltransferase family protein [Tepidibacillus sp. HK-1]GBF12456.1 CMP-N,N'-diacetyllegionaminic acid synthase [Tepidibacillus sp. HK-1]
MKNLAIIPARSGSKGLKDKNIRLLNGKPLLAYTIEAAKESGLFEEIFVSTDSKKYAEIAREWGASVPFLRSDELSTDTASSWDVVKDAIKRYQDLGKELDTVALLQPTSPLRTAEDIIAGYNKMKERDANAVVAVCEVDHSPLWSNTLPEDSSLNNFINRDLIEIPRQSLPTYFRINGALYIVKTQYLMMTENIYTDKSFAIVMSKEHSIDIDDEMDFIIAEALMKNLEK